MSVSRFIPWWDYGWYCWDCPVACSRWFKHLVACCKCNRRTCPVSYVPINIALWRDWDLFLASFHPEIKRAVELLIDKNRSVQPAGAKTISKLILHSKWPNIPCSLMRLRPVSSSIPRWNGKCCSTDGQVARWQWSKCAVGGCKCNRQTGWALYVAVIIVLFGDTEISF